jgi:GH43 family beta-xylosidase
MNSKRSRTLSFAGVLAALSSTDIAITGCSPEGVPSAVSAGAGTSGGGGAASGGSSGLGGNEASAGLGGETDSGGAPAAGGAAAVPLPGFRAEYFSLYRIPLLSRVEAVIDHVWDGETAEPGPGIGEDRFSARYTATLNVPEAGTYTFATQADDGVRLWIGGELVIDDWRAHSAERHEGDIELSQGEVPLELEYFEAKLAAELSLYWTAPGGSEELLDEGHVTATSGDPTPPMPDYTNAVLKSSCPDPGVFADGSLPTFYMICTGGKLRIYTSYDLVLWEATENFVLPTGKPSWADNGNKNWAPEMHQVGDRYIVYYTTVNGSNVLSIGASWADDPLGPYTESEGPLVEHVQGVIDPHYFRDTDGKQYLTYKIDGNAHGQPTPIYIRELAQDGLSFVESSAQVELLRNDSATWEGGVVEGQWLIEKDGTYFLFYSGNVYNYQYRTGVARADDLFGPYVKHGEPILTNNDAWVGPGHGSVVRAGTGSQLYFVYHAWVEDGAGKNDSSQGRQVLVDRITFESDWPLIANGSPSTTALPRPGSE